MRERGRKLSEVARLAARDRLPTLHGQFWHHLFEGSPENKKLAEIAAKRHNDIVYTQKELTLGLLLGEPLFTGGILYHAFGAGDPSWDTLGITAVDPLTDDTLFDELATGVGRLTPDLIVYLDGPGGSVLPDYNGATAIKIQTTLPFSSPMNGSYFREQGLFGGEATTTRETGRMIDTFRHERRLKSISNEIVYFVELFFA